MLTHPLARTFLAAKGCGRRENRNDWAWIFDWHCTQTFAKQLIVVLLLVCIETGSATAAKAQSTERRIALVIGNSNYVGRDLDNPVNDAQLIADSLRRRGFEVEVALNVDRRNFADALVRYRQRMSSAGERGVGVIYYAGHAFQVDGENHLLPIDFPERVQRDAVELHSITASAVTKNFENSGSRLNFLILDACRDNPFKTAWRSWSAEGLATMQAPAGTFIAYATAPGEVASDGEGANSPFALAIAESLNQQGLTAEEVFKYARTLVLKRTSKKQIPWDASSLHGDAFYFYPNKKLTQLSSTYLPVDTAIAFSSSPVPVSSKPSGFSPPSQGVTTLSTAGSASSIGVSFARSGDQWRIAGVTQSSPFVGRLLVGDEVFAVDNIPVNASVDTPTLTNSRYVERGRISFGIRRQGVAITVHYRKRN